MNYSIVYYDVVWYTFLLYSVFSSYFSPATPEVQKTQSYRNYKYGNNNQCDIFDHLFDYGLEVFWYRYVFIHLIFDLIILYIDYYLNLCWKKSNNVTRSLFYLFSFRLCKFPDSQIVLQLPQYQIALHPEFYL